MRATSHPLPIHSLRRKTHMQRTPVLVVLLRTEEAWALAQLLKRMTLEDYQRFAVDLEEALHMQDAGQAIRAELAREGYPPHQALAQ
jgi:hypothetical protein